MITAKASLRGGRLREQSTQYGNSREVDRLSDRATILTQRLREARFTAGFCSAVYAHLDPITVCATAAAQLHENFRYRLALFSFALDSELDSMAFVPTRGEGGATEIQQLVLDSLHATGSGLSQRSTGVMGAEISLSLPAGFGELRLYQVEKESKRVSGAFLQEIADCLAAALSKARDHRRMRELALRDGMTGLFNRRAFDELLEIEGERRETSTLSLLLIDIDNFKSINDHFGHPAGDEVITAIGRAIGEECRGGDLAARYGGEEFAVLLPGASIANATRVGERIRGRIASLCFNFSTEAFRVTGSIGVACRAPQGGGVKELISQADSAMYAAKRQGRNRVSVHDASQTKAA